MEMKSRDDRYDPDDGSMYYSLPEEDEATMPVGAGSSPGESHDKAETTAKNYAEKERPSKNPLWLFVKLICGPVEGWKAIRRAKLSARAFEFGCFFPWILAAGLSSIADFMHNSAATTASVLTKGITTAVAYILTYYGTAILCEIMLPQKVCKALRTSFGSIFIMAAILPLVLARIIGAWMPILVPALFFMPIYSIYLVVKGVKFLRIPTDTHNKTIAWVSIASIGLTLLFNYIFE